MIDKHHLLFPRQEWTLRPEAKRLRNTPSLIPPLDREDHNETHRLVPMIPMLGYQALRRVVHDFHPQRDTIASIDDLLLSLDSAARHERSHPIENAQIRLTQQALELERDIIKQMLRPHLTTFL